MPQNGALEKNKINYSYSAFHRSLKLDIAESVRNDCCFELEPSVDFIYFLKLATVGSVSPSSLAASLIHEPRLHVLSRTCKLSEASIIVTFL